MKYVLAAIGVLVLAVLVCGGWLLVSLFDAAPAIAERPVLTAADLDAVRAFVRQVDPRNKVAGSLTELTVREQDIEQALNYGFDNLQLGRARFDIEAGIATLGVSLPVRGTLPGGWLNAEAGLQQQGSALRVVQLRIGSIEVPPVVGDRVLAIIHAELQQQLPDYAAVVSALDHYMIGDDELTVSYRWQQQLFDQLSARGRELLLPPDLQQRLQAHAQALTQFTRAPELPARLPLTTLLHAMLQFAGQRGGDAVEENRAALQVMAMYVMNVDMRLLLGQEQTVRPARHELQLAGRRDLAQHLLVSAALAVTADAALTQEIALLKEMQDAEAGGSGFSFTDLAIDRAGARLGELATRDTAAALRLQQLSDEQSLVETLFVPDLAGLPEFMPQAEFEQRFTAVGSPAYNSVTDDIEMRINALPLYAPE